MPSIKDFEKKHDKKSKAKKIQLKEESAQKLQRRPGREEGEPMSSNDGKIKVVDVESSHETSSAKQVPQEPAENKSHKVEISFPGSELLRARFPRPFDLAEAVATDWMQDGRFESLPVENPTAKMVAQQGLLKAKEIEKKVMSSPVTEKVAMQLLTAGMRAQGWLEQIRSKVSKK